MMNQPFQQQQASPHNGSLRSAAKPQHGQKTDPEARRISEQRTFSPRPQH